MDNLPPDLEAYVPKRPRGIRPTRLDAARAVIRDFIAQRKTDRIGVVVFGADAYVLAPPTLDYHLLDGLVARMDLDLIAAMALRLATRSVLPRRGCATAPRAARPSCS